MRYFEKANESDDSAKQKIRMTMSIYFGAFLFSAIPL